MVKKILIGFLFLLLLVGCSGFNFKSLSFQKILPEEVKSKLDKAEDFKIIDVRDSDEFESGHIPNALSLPYNQGHFKEQYAALDWGKDVLIVIADSYENRANDAVKILANSGYTQAKILKGGMIDWQKYGYPIIKE